MDNATKRQLKQQDQFVSLTEHGLGWASENKQSATVLIIAVVGLILIAVGGYTLFQRRSDAAATAFGTAMQTYQTPLTNPAQPAPAGMKTYATGKDRAEAANKLFAQVADQYGMTKPGKMAAYFTGVTFMEEGQYQSAEDSLKKSASSWDGGLAALSKLALAQVYQQTGRNDQAADLYNELAKGNSSTVSPGLAQIQLGEMYQAEGKTDEARKVFAAVKDKDKDAKGQPGPAGEVASQKLNPQAAMGPMGQ